MDLNQIQSSHISQGCSWMILSVITNPVHLAKINLSARLQKKQKSMLSGTLPCNKVITWGRMLSKSSYFECAQRVIIKRRRTSLSNESERPKQYFLKKKGSLAYSGALVQHRVGMWVISVGRASLTREFRFPVVRGHIETISQMRLFYFAVPFSKNYSK